MRVLIVGATGVLGGEAARCLRAAGHDVRGMTRSKVRASELGALGVDPVVGDLTDHASLARACTGVDAVFAAAHGALGRGRYRSEAVDDAGHRALVDAAGAAGVARFVYTSAAGAAHDHPVDFFRTKWAVEQYVAASGLDYAIVRPAALMEWHAHAFNGKALLERGRTILLGDGTKKRNFVAARDVAIVIESLVTGKSSRHRIVAVVGPGDFSNDEVAQMYASAAGIPGRVSHVPRSVVAGLASIARPLHPGVARAMRISSLPDDAFPETAGAEDPAIVQVVGPTTLSAFVAERVLEYGTAR